SSARLDPFPPNLSSYKSPVFSHPSVSLDSNHSAHARSTFLITIHSSVINMQFPILLLALGSLVAGDRCYKKGHKGKTADIASAVYNGCSQFINREYDEDHGGLSCVHVPLDATKPKENWLFDIRNISPGKKTLEFEDCRAAMYDTFYGCDKFRGGISTTSDWRFRSVHFLNDEKMPLGHLSGYMRVTI
ncbi:hypothetical protein GGR57DRAFT_517994, partial [Xylariaceae sp. FL1272]